MGSKSNKETILKTMSNHQQLEAEHLKVLKELEDIKSALDASTIVAITDDNGVINYVNEKFCEISRYSRDELLGKTHRIINSGFHPPSFFREMWQTIKAGQIWKGEVKNKAKDGSEYWVSTTIVPFLNEAGIPYQYVAIRTDITDRKHTEASLEDALKNDFRQTIKNLENVIFKFHQDSTGKFIFTLAEGKVAEQLNFVTERVYNKDVRQIFPRNMGPEIEQYCHEAYAGKHVHFETRLRESDFLVYLSPIIKENQVIEVVGTAIDITRRKKMEETINHMAYHDILTGLPNRLYFNEKIEERIKLAAESNEVFAVMFLDLDRFKSINDTLGHGVGDQLLQAVANRLSQILGQGEIVSRFGGDEYAILLPNMGKADATTKAQSILDELGQFFVLDNVDIYISPSIGISLFPEHGREANTLIKNADTAMYHAKEKGKNNFQFFTDELNQRLHKKMLLESELRKALEQDQLELYYQPQIQIDTNRLIGVEALLRWKHPELGMIPPADFIPLAEETGLIIPMGEWILRTACEQNKAWQLTGYKPITMSVNISIRQFMSRGFIELVKQILEEVELAPEYLDLEITEGMTSDVQYTEQVLTALRELGVKVSIDDFGTGYSSLSYLSKLPINKLKIDQAFLREMDGKNKAIVKTVIALAKNLDIAVIAEGVETEDHVDFLIEQECQLAQGYLYSKPLDRDGMETYLNKKVV